MMNRLLVQLMSLQLLAGCSHSASPAPSYLLAAARHCNYGMNQLGWLQKIVESGQYRKPDATLPAPIQQISLSGYGGSQVFLLDSDLSSCVVCPWAILDCDGQPFMSKSSLTPMRDEVIWKRR